MDTDRRKHTRIPIELEAELTFPDGSAFHGTTKNLSFCGAFVSCDELIAMPKQGDCVLKLILGAEKESASIKITAQIVRSNKNGVGVMFSSITIEDYNHLKKLMVFNSSDPETLIDELERYPGLNKIGECPP
ncbi:MAG: PilZ domain-containing protein [Desulfobulbaceae bacterium]|nr:PilZ domain-containing protein [Desulfobulbaceae bacterium]MCK5323291.1 PilZ domain-containing protein [Desulfobulbaceae bacterium]MCK5436618.1 PilZ domain-containing protein [Desulfobulbaceae bacterium]MCK5544297.1 PilZ domain-containing protein [Desulfobulbaceae bacterium]